MQRHPHDEPGWDDAHLFAALEAIQQLLDLIVHLGQARDIVLSILRAVEGVKLGEEPDQLVIPTADKVSHRIVIVHELVSTDQVVEIPFVDVVGNLLVGGERGPVVASQQVQNGRLQLLGFANVGVGEVVEPIVPQAVCLSQADIGEVFGIPQ